jgi:hypothetical protein
MRYAHGLADNTKIQQVISKAVTDDDNDDSSLQRLDAWLSKLNNSIHTTMTNLQMLKSELDELSGKQH